MIKNTTIYKLKIILLVLSITSVPNIFGQTRFWERTRIGLGAGGISYMGDLRNPYTKLAVQGTLTYKLNDHFNIRGQVLLGTIGASDRTTPTYESIWNYTYDTNGEITSQSLNPRARPHPFTSKIQEVNALLEYNLLSQDDGYKWTPYVFLGLGYFNYNAKYKYYDAQTNRTEELTWLINSKNVNVPLGGGLKYFINDDITLYAEGNFRYTRVDDIDGLINTSSSKSNDYFYSMIVGVIFRLKSRNNNDGLHYNRQRKSKNACPPVYL